MLKRIRMRAKEIIAQGFERQTAANARNGRNRLIIMTQRAGVLLFALRDLREGEFDAPCEVGQCRGEQALRTL